MGEGEGEMVGGRKITYQTEQGRRERCVCVREISRRKVKLAPAVCIGILPESSQNYFAANFSEQFIIVVCPPCTPLTEIGGGGGF